MADHAILGSLLPFLVDQELGHGIRLGGKSRRSTSRLASADGAA